MAADDNLTIICQTFIAAFYMIMLILGVVLLFGGQRLDVTSTLTPEITRIYNFTITKGIPTSPYEVNLEPTIKMASTLKSGGNYMIVIALFALIALSNKIFMFYKGSLECLKGQDLMMVLLLMHIGAICYGSWELYSWYTEYALVVQISTSSDSNTNTTYYKLYENVMQVMKVNEDVSWFVDYFQTNYECCGFYGPQDYELFKVRQLVSSGSTVFAVPRSCCKTGFEEKCDQKVPEIIKNQKDFENVHKKTCLGQINLWIADGFSLFLGLAIGAIIFFVFLTVALGYLVFEGFPGYDMSGEEVHEEPSDMADYFRHLIIFAWFGALAALSVVVMHYLIPVLAAKSRLDLKIIPGIARILVVFAVFFILLFINSIIAIANMQWSLYTVFAFLKKPKRFKGQLPMAFLLMLCMFCIFFLWIKARDYHDQLLTLPHINATSMSDTSEFNTTRLILYKEVLSLVKSSSSTATVFDWFQTKYECCGLYGMADFVDFPVRDVNKVVVLPKSCFKLNENGTIDEKLANTSAVSVIKVVNSKNAHVRPCREPINSMVKDRFFHFQFGFKGFNAAFVVVAFFAFTLVWGARELKKDEIDDVEKGMSDDGSDNRSSSSYDGVSEDGDRRYSRNR